GGTEGSAQQPPSAQGSLGDDIRREVIEPLRREIDEAKREAAEDARQDAEEAKREAEEAKRDAQELRRDAQQLRRELKQELAPQALAAEIRREVMDAASQMGDQEHVIHSRLRHYLPQVGFLF